MYSTHTRPVHTQTVSAAVQGRWRSSLVRISKDCTTPTCYLGNAAPDTSFTSNFGLAPSGIELTVKKPDAPRLRHLVGASIKHDKYVICGEII